MGTKMKSSCCSLQYLQQTTQAYESHSRHLIRLLAHLPVSIAMQASPVPLDGERSRLVQVDGSYNYSECLAA